MSKTSSTSRVSPEDRAYVASKGVAFARQCEGIPNTAFQAAVAEAGALIRETLEVSGAERDQAIEAAAVFIQAASIEHGRLCLGRANPGGSA